MLKSMTGYGKAVGEINNKRFTVEIKSLNSKQADISTRIPSVFREKEIEIRSYLSQKLLRGKIDFSLYSEVIEGENNSVINQVVFTEYHRQIKNIASKMGITEPSDYFTTILRMPDVLKTEYKELNQDEWVRVLELISEAVSQIDQFRAQEGAALETDILFNINHIIDLRIQTEQFETERIELLRNRINENLKEISGVEYDKNRFEQEMIYYLEKLDINEEKVRLQNHCNYFIETVNDVETQGRKLGFIAQEIGREINTMGSKANHNEMQKLVILMKDDLERVKEQTLNVL